MKILCLGDVVGRPGRQVLKQCLQLLVQRCCADLVVVNGENSAGGLGISQSTAEEIRHSGADVITLGDHTWQKKESHAYINSHSDWIIRPANYPPGAPGRGWTIVQAKNQNQTKIGVFNLLGRVFMNFPLDCPFRTADSLLAEELRDCAVIIGDVHAEATSEKVALGRYLDGRVSLIFGTHTHVQTADESILSGGTAYISDVGMTGCLDGVIGMNAAIATKRFLSGMPLAYEVAEGPGTMQGVLADIDIATGKALSIERVKESI